MIWRPAWPHSGSSGAPTKTVNSSRLPTIPTGQAHISRRMPRIAEASPKALPTTSLTRSSPPGTER